MSTLATIADNINLASFKIYSVAPVHPVDVTVKLQS